MLSRRILPYFMFLAVSCWLFALLCPRAWAKETDEEMPIAATGGVVHADLFTGVATTSIPIEVPPGRNGL